MPPPRVPQVCAQGMCLWYAGSPFDHVVLDGRQASAQGPGLDKAIVHRSTSFNVFTAAVGDDASLDVSVQGNVRLT